jgi:mannose-6-phosphate isomerase-like protein (cupin superfamily)
VLGENTGDYSDAKHRTPHFSWRSNGCFPFALMGQSAKTTTQAKAVHVSSGEDRFGEQHILGVSSTNFKVSTQDSGGGHLIMEHTNRKKGGPPRHLHYKEDEWFYAVEGECIVEVGPERFRLQPGDSILGPREVPHVWAFVGTTHRLRASQQDGRIFSANSSDTRRCVFKSEQCPTSTVDARLWHGASRSSPDLRIRRRGQRGIATCSAPRSN